MSFYPFVVLADTPQAYYRLGELSGPSAYDQTSHHYTGTISGGVTLGQVGALANDGDTSMLLDGNTGAITLSNSLSPTGWTAFSLECWVNLSSVAGFPVLIGNSTADSNNKGFYLYVDTSRVLNLAIGNGSSNFTVSTPVCILKNTWQHIICTVSSTTVSFYLNGALLNAPSVAFTSLGAATHPIALGFLVDQNAQYAAGLLDEVAIYNTVLSSARVQAHYRAGAQGVPVPYAAVTVLTRDGRTGTQGR